MGVAVRQKVKGCGNPWYIFIHNERKIRSKKIGDKKSAEAVAAKLRKKLLAGRLKLDDGKANTPRFGQYAQHYLRTFSQIVKCNTLRGYEKLLAKHLLPVWGNRRLGDIKRADVRRLIREKQAKGLRNGTIMNIKNVVSAIFSLAVEREVVPTNPATNVRKYLPRPEQKKDITVLTREQVSDLLGLVQRAYPEHYPLLLCSFRTGMRMGELAGLAWDDIDFGANLIQVRRSYSHGHFSSPKSRKSRYIDMSDQLRQTLLVHRGFLVQKFGGTIPVVELKKGFKPDRIRLVFPTQTGGPLDGDNIRKRVFYRLLEKADIRRIRFHDIRHTFASLLLQQGESLHYVKEQMGHASIQTTVDIYGHIVPGSNRKAVNRLDDDSGDGLRLVSDAG